VPDGDPFAFFQLQSRIIAFVKSTFKTDSDQATDAIIRTVRTSALRLASSPPQIQAKAPLMRALKKVGIRL
jgi:hypothetical protein